MGLLRREARASARADPGPGPGRDPIRFPVPGLRRVLDAEDELGPLGFGYPALSRYPVTLLRLIAPPSTDTAAADTNPDDVDDLDCFWVWFQ
jgi:hypothetical protein